MSIDLLIEGDVDELVVRRVFAALGLSVGTVYGRRGIHYLMARAAGIAVRGAYGHQVLILADRMDIGAQCCGEAIRRIVEDPPAGTLVRLAVNEIEAWIIASRAEVAHFLGVSSAHVPERPDEIADPKQALVNLARRSRKSRLRDMMVPRVGISAVVGPGYVDAVAEFLANDWSLEKAVECSPSLARLKMRALERFG